MDLESKSPQTASSVTRIPGRHSLIGGAIMAFSIIMVFVIGHYLNLFGSKIEFGFRHLLFFGNIGFGFFGVGYAFTGSGRVGFKSSIFVLSVFAFAFGAGWLAGNYS